jgi:hypothetical protein
MGEPRSAKIAFYGVTFSNDVLIIAVGRGLTSSQGQRASGRMVKAAVRVCELIRHDAMASTQNRRVDHSRASVQILSGPVRRRNRQGVGGESPPQ